MQKSSVDGMFEHHIEWDVDQSVTERVLSYIKLVWPYNEQLVQGTGMVLGRAVYYDVTVFADKSVMTDYLMEHQHIGENSIHDLMTKVSIKRDGFHFTCGDKLSPSRVLVRGIEIMLNAAELAAKY